MLSQVAYVTIVRAHYAALAECGYFGCNTCLNDSVHTTQKRRLAMLRQPCHKGCGLVDLAWGPSSLQQYVVGEHGLLARAHSVGERSRLIHVCADDNG